MFKFIHTSDIHFGAGRRLTPKSRDYLDRHVQHLMEIVKLAESKKVDFVLISGDVFEDSGTTIEELIAAFEFFQSLGKICPVICTAGNHDELTVNEFQTDFLESLKIKNVYFASSPQIINLGIVSVLAVPWTGLKEQEAFNLLIEKHLTPEVEIVMLHECFKGISTDVGYKAIKGIQVPDFPQVRYYACGDIHKHQKLNLPHAYMSGAPLQQNFGDRPGKGVLLVQAEPQGIYEPTFIKIPSHIELHQINDVAEIPSNSPHWYKLVCEANKVPSSIPPEVKVVEPIPIKIELPTASTTELLDKPYINIDYAEGVDLLMQEMGYSEEAIHTEIKFVRETAAL